PSEALGRGTESFEDVQTPLGVDGGDPHGASTLDTRVARGVLDLATPHDDGDRMALSQLVEHADGPPASGRRDLVETVEQEHPGLGPEPIVRLDLGQAIACEDLSGEPRLNRSRVLAQRGEVDQYRQRLSRVT